MKAGMKMPFLLLLLDSWPQWLRAFMSARLPEKQWDE